MKALTVCQPYAHLIIHGPAAGSEISHWGRKMFENRSWRSDYRGPLAIHAGLSRSWLDLAFLQQAGLSLNELVFGAVIGIVQMNGTVSPAAAASPWAPGPNCLVLPKVLRVLTPPVRFTGKQGFFEVPDALLNGMVVEGGGGVYVHAPAAKGTQSRLW